VQRRQRQQKLLREQCVGVVRALQDSHTPHTSPVALTGEPLAWCASSALRAARHLLVQVCLAAAIFVPPARLTMISAGTDYNVGPTCSKLVLRARAYSFTLLPLSALALTLMGLCRDSCCSMTSPAGLLQRLFSRLLRTMFHTLHCSSRNKFVADSDDVCP
jgi:hypothetical protein